MTSSQKSISPKQVYPQKHPSWQRTDSIIVILLLMGDTFLVKFHECEVHMY